MKKLPSTIDSLLLRTDFTDDLAWNNLCNAAQKPYEDGYRAYFDCVSAPSYDGLTVETLTNMAINDEKYDSSFICVADRITLTDPEQPILVIDCCDEDCCYEPGRTFRVISSEVWAFENNLSIANRNFEDFADSCDPDGVFRGF